MDDQWNVMPRLVEYMEDKTKDLNFIQKKNQQKTTKLINEQK